MGWGWACLLPGLLWGTGHGERLWAVQLTDEVPGPSCQESLGKAKDVETHCDSIKAPGAQLMSSVLGHALLSWSQSPPGCCLMIFLWWLCFLCVVLCFFCCCFFLFWGVFYFCFCFLWGFLLFVFFFLFFLFPCVFVVIFVGFVICLLL